jgi:hypothetical protein
VKIINISNNIGIPIGFSLKDYNELTSWCDYKPITQDQFYELFIRVNNKVPFSKRFIILTFYYKDILNNYYQSDFDICLNDIDDRKMYTTRLLNNKLCINDTVNWLEKTEFTEHKDYTYVTDV